MQTSFIARYSSLTFTPDWLGDLLFTGIAQDAYKQNVAYAAQSDASYEIDDSHTIRGRPVPAIGSLDQQDRRSEVLAYRRCRSADSATCRSRIVDNGAKTEWL